MRLSLGIFALCSAALLSTASFAGAGDCTAITAASIKQSAIPYRGDMTIVRAGGQQIKGQTVYMVTKLYTQVDGKWSVTPINAAQLAQQIQASMKSGSLSCAKAGADNVGGEAATIYTAHDVQQGNTVDTKSWISNSRGLPLKSEAHINANPGGQIINMTFNYSNVSAPAGVN